MQIEGKMRLISQRAYPKAKYVPQYLKRIEQIADQELRLALKLLCCSGLRIGELLNSYLYIQDGKLIIRALAEKVYTRRDKRRVALHKMPKRGFLGERYLVSMLSQGVWRSKEVKTQLFDAMQVAELYDLASPGPGEPEWIGPRIKRTYHALYKALKAEFEVSVNYRVSKREVPFKAEFKPSFHFFRKLYAAQLSKSIQNMSPVQAVTAVVDDMQWESPNMLMTYVKDY